MSTRDTSIEAYHAIRDNGLLSKRRFQVYDELYHNGPLTANEVVRKYQRTNPNIKDASINGRFSELERIGVIRDTGEVRVDEISGHNCILWDVTSNLPVKPEKKKTFKERKEDLLADVVKLGERLPMTYKGDLRKIYHKLNEL
jgi:hypothetical protein